MDEMIWPKRDNVLVQLACVNLYLDGWLAHLAGRSGWEQFLRAAMQADAPEVAVLPDGELAAVTQSDLV